MSRMFSESHNTERRAKRIKACVLCKGHTSLDTDMRKTRKHANIACGHFWGKMWTF